MCNSVLADLNDGLILYYSFDNDCVTDSGSNGFDASSSTGIVHNSSGKHGGACYGDGVGDNKVIIPDYDIEPIETVAFWIRVDRNLANSGISDYITHKNSGNFESPALNTYTGNPKQDLGVATDLSDKGCRASFHNDESDNAWHHVVITRNSANSDTQIYTDGQLETCASTYAHTPNSIIQDSEIYLFDHPATGYEFDGGLDEFAFWNRTFNQTDVSELYSGAFYPFTDKDSILATDFKISDIKFKSSDYTTLAVIEGNSSTDANYTFFSSFNIIKETGAGSNIIDGRILLNNQTISEETLRTVSATGESGSAGFKPTIFNISSGTYNITFQVKRSGTGILSIKNIDFVLAKLETPFYSAIRGGLINISAIDSTSTEFQDLQNFSIVQTYELPIFYYDKLSITSSSSSTYPAFRIHDRDTGENSTANIRSLTSSSVGSVAISWLQQNQAIGTLNKSIQSLRNGTETLKINGSLAYIILGTNTTEINSFTVTNSTSHYGTTLDVFDGQTKKLISKNTTLENGDSVFITASLSVETKLSDIDAKIIINSTDANCSTQKTRFVSAGSVGVVFANLLCSGLTHGNNYNFEFYLVNGGGGTLKVWDETMSGFDVTELDITKNNIAPLEGTISDITYLTGESYTINWSEFTDPNGDQVLYNVSLINASNKYTLCSGISVLSCLFDTTNYNDSNEFPATNYNITVTAYDDNGGSTKSTEDNNVIDNTLPEINFLTPASGEFWTGGQLIFNCQDIRTITGSEVNDSRFVYNSSCSSGNATTNATWCYDYSPNVSVENIVVEVNCFDKAGNVGIENKNLSVDTAPPSCTPLSNQDLGIGGVFNWNVNCTDDLNLYYLNVSCSGGTNFSFYEENLNTTSYNFVNSTGTLSETMTCNFTTADAHTLSAIQYELNPLTVSKTSKSIILDKTQIISTKDEVTKIKLDFSKNDRVRYSYIMNSPLPIKEKLFTYVFYVEGKQKVDYIKNDKYNGWFVIDRHYWADFNLRNDDGKTKYKIQKISNTKYKISIITPLKTLDFESVGIINTNTQTQVITVKSALSCVLDTHPYMKFDYKLTNRDMIPVFCTLISAKNTTHRCITKVKNGNFTLQVNPEPELEYSSLMRQRNFKVFTSKPESTTHSNIILYYTGENLQYNKSANLTVECVDGADSQSVTYEITPIYKNLGGTIDIFDKLQDNLGFTLVGGALLIMILGVGISSVMMIRKNIKRGLR